MIAILIAGAVSIVCSIALTRVMIAIFARIGKGQPILGAEDRGPTHHMTKKGTATMGGIAILISAAIGWTVAHVRDGLPFSTQALIIWLTVFVLAAFGFIDDFLKVRRRRSLGLTKRGKLLGQAVVALAFAAVAVRGASVPTELSFLRGTGLDLGIFFALWVFVILASSSNGVNLTDGLDGLASGSSILVLSAYVFIAFWQFRHACEATAQAAACYPIDLNAALDVAIVAGAAVGAVSGFLWWNAAPARIFMGDTGALAIGGLIGALAIVTSTQLLLLILGGLFVIETASVIAQVISYRGFGRRIFRMSPIHHHFELAGWPEFTVIVRFWIISGLVVAIGIGLFYADFIARGGLG